MVKKGIDSNHITYEDWKELCDKLTFYKCLSTYNLLDKKTFKMVQFFEHPSSPGELPCEAISICISKVPEWEIYLLRDGTWALI